MKKNLLIIASFFFFVLNIFGQEKEELTKYRRSSLHLIMLEFDDYEESREQYRKCFNLVPFPSKYNDHRLGDKFFQYKNYQDYVDNTMRGKNVDIFNMESSISQYFDEKKIANQLVAKWFQRDPITGSFSMDLIQERGLYDASELDKDLVKNTIRGTSTLADAGEDLIANTFVVVCRIRYIQKEETARTWTEGVKKGASESKNDLASGLIGGMADLFYKHTKDGYEVRTDAFLYQLIWNEEVASRFYNEYWISKGETNEERKQKFEKSHLFELQYIGTEHAVGKVLFTSSTQSRERISEIATVRNFNNVFTKLQKNYDVFKTKTPIINLNPLGAEIGLKEGLEKGDKYEVLEAKMDEETGKMTYVRKGTTSVTKDIWDNRYGADEDPKSKKTNQKFTIFKGVGGFYPGQLLRQIK